jgi:hypothetical protein
MALQRLRVEDITGMLLLSILVGLASWPYRNIGRAAYDEMLRESQKDELLLFPYPDSGT